ncbi:MAG: hypothetical protein Q9221_001918 [Calogaya cf. arnoldii]
MRFAEFLVFFNLLFSFISAVEPGGTGQVAGSKPGVAGSKPAVAGTHQSGPYVNQAPAPPPNHPPAVRQGGLVPEGGTTEALNTDASAGSPKKGDQNVPSQIQNQNADRKNQPSGGSGGGSPSDRSSSDSTGSSFQDGGTGKPGEGYKFPEDGGDDDSTQDTTSRRKAQAASTSSKSPSTSTADTATRAASTSSISLTTSTAVASTETPAPTPAGGSSSTGGSSSNSVTMRLDVLSLVFAMGVSLLLCR